MLSSAAAAPTVARAPAPQTFGNLDPHLDLGRGHRLLQRLRVGVGDHEFNTVKLLLDHVVDRVAAGTADTENRDPGLQFILSG